MLQIYKLSKCALQVVAKTTREAQKMPPLGYFGR